MLFNSWVFWIFLPLVLGSYALLHHRRQNVLLLVASCVFYGWWSWKFLALVLVSPALDFFVGLALDRRKPESDDHALSPGRRKALLVFSLIANLGVLGFFKYFHFFEDNLVDLVSTIVGHRVSPTGWTIILPIGISFHTFQSMSYTIDVYRGEIRATRNVVEYGAFVLFFPQLVAGPIVRAKDYLPQIAKPRRYDAARFNEGGYLILWGMFKKVVIADNLSPIVDTVFAAPSGSVTGAMAMVAIYAFAFQIYCDFSGYTDIARGCAKLMGFEFPLNFNLPYAARNPSEFWQRWHISLSTWLRDYLYIPLGGNRVGPVRVYFNLMATMVLGGLWHGASWTFVVWGFYQGLLLVVWRFVGARVRVPDTALVRFVQWLVFFHLVCLGWLIFRARSFDQIVDFLRAIFIGRMRFDKAQTLGANLLILVAPLVGMQLIQHFTKKLGFVLELPAPTRGLIYASMLVGIVLFGQFQGNDFIYFQF